MSFCFDLQSTKQKSQRKNGDKEFLLSVCENICTLGIRLAKQSFRESGTQDTVYDKRF